LRRPSRIIGSASKKDDPSDPDANDPNLAIVEIAKNRNGPAMLDVRLHFDQDLTRFRDRLPRRSMYGAWARILGADYAELVRETEEGRSSVLDQYGATNPAEFFAVATEAFFETSTKLRTQHPQLYAELMLYYQQDPAARGC
jgi:hypothetical protein